mmetsp:Transcript_33245/g.87443  ORF Transcript_33245/g.87443 Transcript_33245/m.87443 type:complete len:236 (+) Transcript_33245:209-916(+)|eukprot:CAMPEP_0115866614 /NCGR_PEP_ID=MMETSP0287-20121206/20340_1 /TAXON_ID=412157 /ORGANISM="Chrysochromulina rotalis, Strain UIO044" /LENGTH=235 /DNA_ID=CAMNT_0003321187 /DNA_START=198 /DNA_END=905 /DNA_ORIENTATION=+
MVSIQPRPIKGIVRSRLQFSIAYFKPFGCDGTPLVDEEDGQAIKHGVQRCVQHHWYRPKHQSFPATMGVNPSTRRRGAELVGAECVQIALKVGEFGPFEAILQQSSFARLSNAAVRLVERLLGRLAEVDEEQMRLGGRAISEALVRAHAKAVKERLMSSFLLAEKRRARPLPLWTERERSNLGRHDAWVFGKPANKVVRRNESVEGRLHLPSRWVAQVRRTVVVVGRSDEDESIL